jgi:hypothetical protein
LALDQLKELRLMMRCLAGVAVAFASVWWFFHGLEALADSGTLDFAVYYSAALALQDHPHANIFDLRVLQAAAAAHHSQTPLLPYVYPPLLAISLRPLATLSFPQAARIWAGFNLALWLGATVLLAAELRQVFAGERASLGDERLPTRPGLMARFNGFQARRLALSDSTVFAVGIAVFTSLTYAPMVKGVMLGQVTVVIFFLLVLAPWFIQRRQPELAGAVLALATLIKVLPIVLIGYYVLRGRWRLAAGALACLALLSGAMLLALGPNSVVPAARSTLGNQAALGIHNQALWRVPYWVAVELGGRPSPTPTLLGYVLMALVGLAFAIGVVAVSWRAHRRPLLVVQDDDESGRNMVGYAWAISTMVLISPVAWEHYDSWLVPAFVFALGHAARLLLNPERGGRWESRAAGLVVILVVTGFAVTSQLLPFDYDMHDDASLGPYFGHLPIRPLFMVLRPLAALLVWAAIGWMFLTAGSAAGEDSGPGRKRRT